MKSLAVFSTALLVFNAQAQEDGTNVQTQQGLVAGTIVSSSQTVRRFLGVPYAVANRWEAPQAPPSRNATFDATNYGDSCVQSLTASAKEFLVLAGVGNQTVQESENCLNANIWAPTLQRKQGTAVMIWFYGGGLQYGTSNTKFYDGQNLVRDNDDVIIVTVNYRLNIFGQPNAPQLVSDSESQNFFFLDAKAAIDWVYANIAAFGGDPEHITIFGQSAGSSIIDMYTYAFPTDTIVKGVIEESGSIAGLPNVASKGNPSASTGWNQVANAVGCGNEEVATPEQLTCMKAVPFRTLEDTVINTGAAFAQTPDDIYLFADTNSRSAAGNFLHVPLLVGNTAQEADIFIVSLELLNLGAAIPGATEVVSDIFTQFFTCPAGTTAGDRTKAGVPTWRYRYEGIFPDISSRPDLRAYHTSEISMIFGTYNSSSFPAPPTTTEIALSRYVQGAWVAFARDPTQGLTHYGWPTYDPNAASLAELGHHLNESGVVFTQGTGYDVGCELLSDSALLLDQVLKLLSGVLSLF